MEEKTFKYYAFISYCSEDEKWAKWLHRHLENYHIPTRLCSEYPKLPKKIRPVFWYKVDLSGTKLKPALEKELDVSNYLIVICSPDSAKSDWVNDEVNSFLKKHDGNRIIPLIVAGEPKSGNPRTECFPPALLNLPREDEIRGINLPQAGKYHALVDIVATMFNVRFDSLWQRHRRRRIRNAIFAAFLGLLALVAGVFAFNYFRTSREYYSNYEFRYGMPTGIDRMKKSDLKSAISHYVFESSRGKLRRVYLSNPFGHPIEENSSFAQFRTAVLDIAYEGDKLSSITFSDANYNPLFKFVYSDDYRRADIKNIESGDAASMFKSSSSTFENMAGQGTFDLNNVFMNTKSQVARYVYDYDHDGYISKIHFKRYNGSNETGYDDNGICGIEYERDAEHRMIKKRYFDENGEYMADKMGCAGTEYAYNERGNIVYERFFDLAGNNHLSDMGYAISRNEYDYPSRTFVENHFGTDEKPIMTIANYHRIIIKINGDTISVNYFDTECQPTLMNFPQRRIGLFHTSKNVYDKQGNEIEMSLYGIDGSPCYDITRFHKVTGEFDDRGRCTKYILYNTEGERQLNIYGISEVQMSYYDDSNNLKSIEYFRRPGVRTNVYGLSKRTYAYSGNKIVKSTCYDSNNLPTRTPINLNVPTVLLDYDDFGNVSDLWLKDESGISQNFSDTFACHAKASYSNGNCVKVEYFNKQGRPAMVPQGYAAMTMEYDKRGRRTATEYLDTLGQPIMIPTLQYARIESEYNPQGNEIETRTYDQNHQPVICFDGWAVKKQEFKDYLVTRIASYGVNGEPTLAKNIDAHIKEIEYDQSRRIISEKYFGLNNEPILNSFGVNEVRYKYNKRGLPDECTTYDTKSRPKNSIQNFQKKVFEFDDRNNQTVEKYFDAAGHLTENTSLGYAFAISEYAPNGQVLAVKAFGPDSLPAENNAGVHTILYRYTPFGDQILLAFLDKENRPTAIPYQNDYFAAMYNIFDDDGRFRGFVTYDNNYNEMTACYPLIENGAERGVLWRDKVFTANLRLPDGTNRELKRYSNSPYDRAYFAMLDSVSNISREEVKRLIEEAK